MFRDTGAAWEVAGAQEYERYINTMGIPASAFVSLGTIGRVYYCPIIIKRTCTIDQFGRINGDPCAGNSYMGIYSSAAEAPANRLAISASTLSAGAGQKQQVALAAGTIRVTPGYYFIALEGDADTDQFGQINADEYGRVPANILNGPSWYYEDLGPYAAPPAVATPLFATDYNKLFFMWVRVSSIP